MSRRQSAAMLAGLDIGTTKTCAVVATAGPDGRLDILGVGEAPSSGVRKGVITDLDETVRSIEAATEKAERMAGVHISHTYVGVTGDHVQSTNNRSVVTIAAADREVVRGDVRRVVEASKLIEVGADRQIIHALARHFSIDGQDGVGDPIGMSGARLEVDMHIVTGGNACITNVLTCVHRAGLEPAGIVFEPLASSAATLSPEEKQRGVLLLDIGGGTTDVAVYAGGKAVATATIGAGGNLLTSDIALGLDTSFAQAEHIKRTLGSAVDDQRGDPHFTVKTLDGAATRVVTRAQLRAIVAPRVLEIFHLAKAHVARGVPRDVMLAEVVITGGGAHLHGIAAAAGDFFGIPTRIGMPTALGGLNDSVKKPEYATAVGLVLFGPKGDAASVRNGRSKAAFGKVATWFGDLWN